MSGTRTDQGPATAREDAMNAIRSAATVAGLAVALVTAGIATAGKPGGGVPSGTVYYSDSTTVRAMNAALASRWDGTTTVIGSAGVYGAQVLFDASGNVTGLASEPTLLGLVGTFVGSNGREYANAHSFSWSPDMAQIVSDRGTAPFDL